jgi:hypothetical protein
MPWTISDALEDELVTVVERDDDEGLYRIRIGALETIITIILRLPPGGQRTEFTVTDCGRTA